MPSARRVRLLVLCAVFIAIAILYMTYSAHVSDQQFYDRTVRGLASRRNSKDRHKDQLPVDPPLGFISDDNPPPRPAAGDKKQEALRPPSPGPFDSSGVGDKDGVAKGVAGGGEPAAKEAEKAAKDAAKSPEEREVDTELGAILKRSPIIIFSKTYCPHSRAAKAVFAKYTLTPGPHIVELDEHPLGPQLQAALGRLTGRRTVPNVLINAISIGGGDDVQALEDRDELLGKIRELAGKRMVESKRN